MILIIKMYSFTIPEREYDLNQIIAAGELVFFKS